MVPCVDRRKQMFTAILDPSDRMLELQCDRGDGNVLRHDTVLAAEPTADVRSDDTNLLFGQAKHPRKRQPLDLTALGREVDDQFVEPIVPVSEDAAPFE